MHFNQSANEHSKMQQKSKCVKKNKLFLIGTEEWKVFCKFNSHDGNVKRVCGQTVT